MEVTLFISEEQTILGDKEFWHLSIPESCSIFLRHTMQLEFSRQFVSDNSKEIWLQNWSTTLFSLTLCCVLFYFINYPNHLDFKTEEANLSIYYFYNPVSLIPHPLVHILMAKCEGLSSHWVQSVCDCII